MALDPGQRAVVDAVLAGQDPALLVLGAPGSGKSTVALEAAVAAGGAGMAPQDVLVLSATRRLAAEMRDRLAARWPHTAGRPLAQTPAAVAFAVLRARAGALGEPAPVLVSGPEQDQVLGELLAGHAVGEGVPVAWPDGVRPDALGLRAFRDELRDLLMRAAERGLAPADLARLGRERRRPEWVAAAQLYGEYLDVMWLRTGTPDLGARLDPAVVVDEASRALLAWDEEVERVPRPRWRLVVVDDHQESTAATARLLRVLADDGARLLLLADPDAAVQTFRGADPALVGRAAAERGTGAFGARVLTLPTVWRHGPALRGVVSAVTGRVGVVAGAEHRRATSSPRAVDGPAPQVALLAGAAQEAAYVAHVLRDAHLHGSIAWGDMAVVARSGDRVTSLRRALAVAGVPVSVLGSQVPLREEPAVRPLLDVLAVVTGRAALDAPVAAGLAQSPVGGLDAVGLRRARRALRAEELAGGGGRASDALLVEALEEPAKVAGLGPEVGAPLRRLARVIAAGRAAAAMPGADAHAVLWAVWDAAGLAEPWRRAALAGGSAGQRADRDLDAVLALFRAAETFVERMPAAPPGSFVDWLLAQDVPADTLAARARRESVPVLTAAGAAGREWELVVVAGVQEGSWPDLRLRDSLLGAQALVDLLDGRAGDAGAPDVAAARQAVLADELRTFAVACSRARTRLVVTAVADLDSEPSPFVDLVAPPAEPLRGPEEAVPDDEPADSRLVDQMPVPLDLRGLVGLLRARIEGTAAAGEPDPAAARTLARLAAAGVDVADPAHWHGLAQTSSDEPLWAADVKVPVSPSRIEQAATCALRWALEAAGGTRTSSREQSLGTLVHAVAQEHPTGTSAELLAALDAQWSSLGLHGGWPEAMTRRKAEAMVERLGSYLRTAGEPLLVEADFRLETERAAVHGKVDRVEAVAGDGPPRVRVVDLKTGGAISGAKAAENPQLAAYQLAVNAGAFEGLPPATTSASALLLYLSASSSGAKREQPGLDAERTVRARELIDEVAGSMADAAFRATRNDLCRTCPVRSSCPVQPSGGQVTG
ncbi:MAG TPA: ATP-dependent DNA helicase [Cellulomonas sp.]